jgi:hemoglobin-like flavoprotein
MVHRLPRMPSAGAWKSIYRRKTGGTRFAICLGEMTPRQIELVQSTWRSMLPIRDTFAELFYGKLFSLDAGLQRLFTGDMREQGRNLAAMISIVVRSLDQPENVAVALQGLGRRHSAYGVNARDYDTVSVALLWTLSHALGDEFTDEAEGAWRETYRRIAEGMQS